MSSPCIYLYPAVGGSLETIDFGEGLTDINELPSGEVEDAYSADGTPNRSFLGTNFRVRIVLERFGFAASSLERKLQNLHAHLHRGGWIGFSRDHAKTWASLSSSAANRGDTLLYTTGNGYSGWSTAGTVDEDDEVVIESADPESNREIALVDSLGFIPPVNLPIQAPGLFYSYAGAQFARWRDFYPWLWLPKDMISRPIVTHDHRRNFTLDMTLEYRLTTALALWGDEGQKPFPASDTP